MSWVEATTVDALADSDVVGVELNGLRLAIYRLDDEYFATDDICTHQFALLSEGYVEDGCVECPIHQGIFNIRTGEPVEGPVDEPLKTYAVKLEADRILVELPE